MQIIELEEIYDLSSDVLNLQSTQDFAFCQTVVLGDGVNVDFDCRGRPVAIELINPFKLLNLRRDILEDSRFDISLEVSSSIRLQMGAVTKNSLIEPRLLDVEVSNDFKIPSGRFAFKIARMEI